MRRAWIALPLLLLPGFLDRGTGGAGAQSFDYLAFGDSITCGSFDTGEPCNNPSGTVTPLHATAGYPARLRAAGRLNCPVNGSGGCMVYNRGKGGEKTGAGITRLQNLLDAQRYDVVLIMEGTNDVFNNISNNTIRNNLAAQDDRARSRGVDTLLASIIRFHPGNPKGTSKDAQIAALRNEIASLASARGRWFADPWTPLCPGPTCFANLYAYPVDNGLHPNANGYTVLADIFRAAIQQAPVPNAVSLIAPPHNAIITSLQVSWHRVGNATWYEVQVDGGNGSWWVEDAAVCSGSQCSWTIPGLAPGTTHTWRVRARNPRGRGAFSAARTFSLVSSLPGVGLTFQPDFVDLGVVAVGSTSPQVQVTLRNTGELTRSGLNISKVGGAAFTVDTAGCPATLAPNASCSVGLRFTPSAASGAGGRLVATAQGTRGDLRFSARGVQAGAGITGGAVRIDPPGSAVGNGNLVLEPGETAEFWPAWRNNEPAATSFTGSSSAFTGPPGANYGLVDASADHGNVAPGQLSDCRQESDCYRVAVSNPAARPAMHWDASLQETTSAGPSRTRVLHIGRSFEDVPVSHGFYAPIEAILHRRVTTGCGGNLYCPATPIHRAAMAAFLLLADEGSGYTPPPCSGGSRTFADVPASHPFCAWIEELERREISAGCGGGNFCPGAPITRASMAVFLLRAREGANYLPPTCSGKFSDVGCPSSPTADWIEELHRRGVVAGCATSPLRYCPATTVNRGQMAQFLTGAFNLGFVGP